MKRVARSSSHVTSIVRHMRKSHAMNGGGTQSWAVIASNHSKSNQKLPLTYWLNRSKENLNYRNRDIFAFADAFIASILDPESDTVKFVIINYLIN
jgi:hypothetical protein